ncbi:hypothetical protein QYM36_017166 [Artemia franciscana]|uniref:Geranylgeranyl transferase type-1 subunit beta n=1 Tax=Artemia franciscana TaxID=6661 RepID=A0AA88H530_ARTSF|nr:hypothetical protein QYM36_017166 [Artemia franciscana]
MVDFEKSAKYFRRCLSALPDFCTPLCCNRLSVAFFCISGLDILNELEILGDKLDVINWIYSFQLISPESRNPEELKKCGFKGSLYATDVFQFQSGRLLKGNESRSHLDTSHIAMTYTGLSCLIIMGDDLSGVDRSAISAGIKALQLENGNFCCTLGGSESDMRFVYCAAAICSILDDWSGINKELTTKFIVDAIGYDGGIGNESDNESHGGLTYCGVAALHLMGTLPSALSRTQVKNLMKWCLMRQITGFQGRPNKPPDTCYSFWVGATLKILESYGFVDKVPLQHFTMSAYDQVTGGIAKWPENHPDPLHSYLGIVFIY